MKVLLAPDSFKGSLPAPEAARAMAGGWRRVFPDAECVLLPVADGGEGTAAALAATGGRMLEQEVTGPLGEPVTARLARLGDSGTAVVELAEAAGLTLVPPGRRDPKVTTTLGVGDLLRTAVALPDVAHVIVALGGSATNDGGGGLLQALGVRLLDADGRDLPPGGAALSRLARLDVSTAVDLSRLSIDIACDVDNPLCGPRGASAVFGPQKGATPEDVALLDAALAHYGRVLEGTPPPPPNSGGRRETAGQDNHALSGTPPVIGGRGGLSCVPGAGAAGGTAAALLWLFPNARLRPGIDIVLDALAFDRHLVGADLVLTGEGSLDAQTLGGKAVAGVARRAQAAGVPVAALVGRLGADVDAALLAERLGVEAALPLAPGPASVEESMANAEKWIADAAERAARWIRLGSLTGKD